MQRLPRQTAQHQRTQPEGRSRSQARTQTKSADAIWAICVHCDTDKRIQDWSQEDKRWKSHLQRRIPLQATQNCENPRTTKPGHRPHCRNKTRTPPTLLKLWQHHHQHPQTCRTQLPPKALAPPNNSSNQPCRRRTNNQHCRRTATRQHRWHTTTTWPRTTYSKKIWATDTINLRRTMEGLHSIEHLNWTCVNNNTNRYYTQIIDFQLKGEECSNLTKFTWRHRHITWPEHALQHTACQCVFLIKHWLRPHVGTDVTPALWQDGFKNWPPKGTPTGAYRRETSQV